MATVTGKITDADGGAKIATWENMAASDVGSAVDLSFYPDKTVQIVGDATGVAMQGSADGTNWVALTDADGNTIALVGSTHDAALIRENTRYIRPSVTGGTSTDVTVIAVK